MFLAFKLTDPVQREPMPDLTILRLSEKQLSQAYPLVRSATGVGPERWEAFGRELVAGGGGVLAAQAGDSCFHGLAAFRAAGSLRHARSLQVELLVAFELSRHSPVRAALCAALADLAREQGCDSIVFTMAARHHADPSSNSRKGWEELGIRMETVDFVQRVRSRRRKARREASPAQSDS